MIIIILLNLCHLNETLSFRFLIRIILLFSRWLILLFLLHLAAFPTIMDKSDLTPAANTGFLRLIRLPAIACASFMYEEQFKTNGKNGSSTAGAWPYSTAIWQHKEIVSPVSFPSDFFHRVMNTRALFVRNYRKLQQWNSKNFFFIILSY